MISGPANLISSLAKLKRSGIGYPLGNFALSYLKSSKNLCAKASIGFNLWSGSYFRIPAMSETASGGVFYLVKSLAMLVGLIYGNLNSE